MPSKEPGLKRGLRQASRLFNVSLPRAVLAVTMSVPSCSVAVWPCVEQ